MPRICTYKYTHHMYTSDCGNTTIYRPIARCDKCGRKPQENKNAEQQEDESNQADMPRE